MVVKNVQEGGIVMLRKLKLYGELAEFVGHKEFEIKVDSLGKAISFLVNISVR